MVRTIRRSYFGLFVVLAAMALLCVLAGSSTAASGSTTLVSVDSSGNQANPGFSGENDMSDDGRYVAFTSSSSTLVSGDTNTFRDVFVHDRDADEDGVFDEVNEPGAISTKRVSMASDGTEANADSSAISISANGRYVAFISAATNLVPNDTSRKDVFVRDRDADEDGVFDEVNEPGAISTERASGDSNGNEANGASYDATDVSSNGRVAFISAATNLVAGDTNGQLDFFVHDLNTGTTERVNVDNDGNQVNGGTSIDISISSNGRYVGFTTNAPNLDPDDPGDVWDGFVRDLDPAVGQTRKIWRVAFSASGAPSISDEGRVAFTSYAPNLVPNDTNGIDDVFVRYLPNGPIQRVSVDSSENQANARSFFGPSISSDGCSVAFYTDATNLVPGDTNNYRDVFVRDLQAQTTERVSVDSSGNQGNGHSFNSSISADGRYAAFNSGATNLDADRPDTNNGGDVFVHERATPQQANDCSPPSDTTPPKVNSTIPSNNATGIASTANVTATFSEEMDRSTLTTSSFTLTKQGSTSPLAATVGYDSSTKTATLDPGSDLAANATYVARVKGDSAALASVRDLAGNSLQQNYSWTFTTTPPPPAPPTVASYTPTQTTGVPRSIRPTATFSTNMDPSTITASSIKFEVYNKTTSRWVSVAHNVSYDSTSKMVTVTPDSTLAASTKYRVTVTTNVKSSTGLALDQDATISGNQFKRWTFTTGTFIDSAVGNFSATQNPNGKWSYGYRASAGSGFVLYPSHANPWGPSFDQWSLNSSPTVTPHVTYNRTGQTASYSTITQPPNLLNLHPGPNGEKSVVRWTAPSSLTVTIKGRFEGIDTHGTTTDVAVVLNSATTATTLFSGNVNGYGAKAPFSITRSVVAGDTIDFYVGYGSNANHGFDSTGLLSTITY